jgi:hypothetical protein
MREKKMVGNQTFFGWPPRWEKHGNVVCLSVRPDNCIDEKYPEKNSSNHRQNSIVTQHRFLPSDFHVFLPFAGK